MLGRKPAGRRHRQLRDRGNPQQPLPRASQWQGGQKPHHVASPSKQALRPTSPMDNGIPITFVWPDARRSHRHVVLVGSFDGWLHHRMNPPTPAPPISTSAIVSDAQAVAAAFFSITLRVAPGEHTYKFLVDGVWCTDPASANPIHVSADGVKHHLLSVTMSLTQRHVMANSLGPNVETGDTQNVNWDQNRPQLAAQVTMARLADGDPRSTTVFRSASASAVPTLRGPAGTAPGGASSSVSLHEAARRKVVELTPRGSSFNAPPTVGSISHTQSVNRKSLLQRVGYGWMKRFSANRPEEVHDPTDALFDTPSAGHADRSASALYKVGKGGSLFPSASDPNVGHSRDSDKENSFKNWATPGTPDRPSSRRGGGHLRGSARNGHVTISRPTKVDEPRDSAEVNKQADNWRQMAKHLQEDLCDPVGARELFSRAIQHREKHGLWCTAQNAQVHVDLARNLSKADQMKDAEFHLRIALRIYNHIEAGPEHVADLLLYIGVVVDRQRRRAEAEDLYREALKMYKDNGLKGNNLDIAIKNLSLNLRKQNREGEVPGIHHEFGTVPVSGSSVIV